MNSQNLGRSLLCCTCSTILEKNKWNRVFPCLVSDYIGFTHYHVISSNLMDYNVWIYFLSNEKLIIIQNWQEFCCCLQIQAQFLKYTKHSFWCCLLVLICWFTSFLCVFQSQDEGLLHRLFSQSSCNTATHRRQVPSSILTPPSLVCCSS